MGKREGGDTVHSRTALWEGGGREDEMCRDLLASVAAELHSHYLWQLPAVGQTGREQVDTVHRGDERLNAAE